VSPTRSGRRQNGVTIKIAAQGHVLNLVDQRPISGSGYRCERTDAPADRIS